MDMWNPFIKAVKKSFRRLKSSLICSMWWPNLTGSVIKYKTADIVRPRQKTRLSLKVPNTCCSKTAKIFVSKPGANNLKTAGIKWGDQHHHDFNRTA
jgi:hypothetical protein